MRTSAAVAIAGVAVGLGFLLGRLSSDTQAQAEEPLTASQNGDVNGDGERNVSDAIHLLQWLFAGGPEPALFECESPARFVEHADGTVTDTWTGLMWLAATADTNADGAIDHQDRLGHDEAYEYALALGFAGHDDWRLPLTWEAADLVGALGAPTGGSSPFDFQESAYWIGSTNGGDPCHGAYFTVSIPHGAIDLCGDHSSACDALVLVVRESPLVIQ